MANKVVVPNEIKIVPPKLRSIIQEFANYDEEIDSAENDMEMYRDDLQESIEEMETAEEALAEAQHSIKYSLKNLQTSMEAALQLRAKILKECDVMTKGITAMGNPLPVKTVKKKKIKKKQAKTIVVVSHPLDELESRPE